MVMQEIDAIAAAAWRERPTPGDLASAGLDLLVLGAAFIVVAADFLLEALLRWVASWCPANAQESRHGAAWGSL